MKMIRTEFRKTVRELKQMSKMPVRLHKVRRCRVARWGSLTAAFVTLVVQLIPVSLHAGTRPKPVINWNQGLTDGLTQTTTPDLRKLIDEKRTDAMKQPDVRALSDSEMDHIKGAGPYRNQYLQGVLPWQKAFHEVNLCSGNLFKSFTDIQVTPGRGAGLALQRSYNSNDDRDGPFGTGWTHAYDIRMQEESDTVPTDETVNLADRADFFGGEHKYHRDADGLYTPPAYMFDELSSDYEKFLTGDPIKVASDTETGMDGTVKHFIKGATGATNPERVCDYIKDRYGNTTMLAYNDVSMPGGVTKKFLSTVTDPVGRTLTFTWTNLGTTMSPAYRITQVSGPQYSVTYAYYTNPAIPASYLNLHTVTLDPGGVNRTTTYTYTSYTGTSGTENGLLASISDPLSHTTSYTYGMPSYAGLGTVWIRSITEPVTGGTHTWTINNEMGGLPWYAYRGVASSPTTVAVGVDVDTSLRSVEQYALRDYTSPMEHKARMYWCSYDTSNNVLHTESTLAVQPTMDMTYGPHGNVLTSTTHSPMSGNAVTTTTYYNASQYFQKATVTDPLGHVTTFGVGTNADTNTGNRGNVLYVRDPGYAVSGNPTYNKQYSYTYNAYGQKISETNPNNIVTNYSYGDTWGNLTQTVQDPHVTMGDSHLARTTSMVYNVGGQMTSSTDPLGQTSSHTYDALGHPLTASFPATSSTSAETVSYTYGGNGRLASVTDNRGTTSIAYETGNDRIASITDPVTGAVTYTYGSLGQRLTMGIPGGGTWTYAYADTVNAYSGVSPVGDGIVMPMDRLDQINLALTRVTDDQGRITECGTNYNGRLFGARWNEVFNTSGTLISYCQTDYSFNSATPGFWLGSITNTYHWFNSSGVPQSSVLTANAYTYNSGGMKLTNQISDSGGVVRTETYGYDEQNHLTSVNYGDSHTQSYTFDAMGNRATKVNDGTTESYTYNAANMLTARGANSYTNDANGNTLTGGGRTNTWDSQNRLYQCVNGSTTTINSYTADGIRHRMASTTGGVTTTRDFVHDSSAFIREQTPSGGGEVNVATYFSASRGPEYRRDDSTGSVRWYCYDGLGSVLGEVNSTGTLTATQSCDVYGSVRTSAGTSTSKHKFVGSLGHTSDNETGLVYMRARYMDPATGRFISEDPARSGTNWFQYALANPTNMVDQDGRNPGFSISTAMAILFAMLTGPLANNPFVQGMLEDFVGLPLDPKWGNALGDLITNTLSWPLWVTNFFGGDPINGLYFSLPNPEFAICNIVAAYSILLLTAIVGDDIAFEEGI